MRAGEPAAPTGAWLAGRGEPGLVSVIIPTYNRAALVLETLSSVAAQGWRPIELIVVDDGSTDDTLARLRAWQRLEPTVDLRIVSQANRGPAAARNAGLRHARGEYLYFIDSDDLIWPEAIETLMARLVETGRPFSVASIQNTNLALDPIVGNTEGIAVVAEGDYFSSRWMTNAALYRRATLARAGPFDETLHRGEDTEHLWRVMATSGAGALVKRLIGVRRVHGYGHLCIGRSIRDAARDDLTVVSRFVSWARATGFLDRRMARSVSRRTLISAMRSGYAREWPSHAEALRLWRSLRELRPAWSRALAALLRIRSRPLFILYRSGLESPEARSQLPAAGCQGTLRAAGKARCSSERIDRPSIPFFSGGHACLSSTIRSC